MRKPTAIQVFNVLSALPFLLFFAAASATSSHLPTGWGGASFLLCALFVCFPPSSLRDAIRTTVRTTSPSAPDPLPYQRERLIANAVVLLALLTLVALGHHWSVRTDTIPLYLTAPTLALFLLQALAQWAALFHLRALTALAALDTTHPGTLSTSRLHPEARPPTIKVGLIRLPVGPRLDSLLRLTAPIADLYLRHPYLAWVP